MITINNVKDLQSHFSVIKRCRLAGENTMPRYKLLESLKVQLTNGDEITIPEGFIWDLASVPRLFWALFPPDNGAELAYLIHDYLWANKGNYTRAFTDKEMLKWAKATNGTKKISLRNFDNFTRYYGVRLFGWLIWNKKK
jgi:hypothetical protein